MSATTVISEAAAADRHRDLAAIGRHVMHLVLALALPAALVCGVAGIVPPNAAGVAGAVIVLAIGGMVVR